MKESTRRVDGSSTAAHCAFRAIVLVALFTAPLLTIDFFHIEDDGLNDQGCPACRLHQSATAEGAAVAPGLPAPVLRPSQPLPDPVRSEVDLTIAATSRSPPPA